MLFEIVAIVIRLRNWGDVAIEIVQFAGPFFLSVDDLSSGTDVAIQKNWLPGLFHEAPAFGLQVIVGMPDKKLLKPVSYERLVEPTPPLNEVALAPEADDEFSTAL